MPHKLEEVDPGNELAWCNDCWGYVTIEVRNPKRSRELSYNWICKTYRRDLSRRSNKHTHGLTRHEAAEYCKEHGPCQICGRSENLVVDHDHKTLKIRGVLCNRCNVALGWLGDNIEGIRRVAKYLKGIQ